MPETITIKLNNVTYDLRKSVSKAIKNGYANRVSMDALDAQDWFVSQMIITPKMTKEQVQELNEEDVDALFYFILDETKFLDLSQSLEENLSEEDQKKKTLLAQKRRINELKKKVSKQSN